MCWSRSPRVFSLLLSSLTRCCSCKGGDIACIVRESLKQNVSFSASFSLSPLLLWSSTAHSPPFTTNDTISFAFTAQHQTRETLLLFFVVVVLNQFLEFLEYCDAFSGKVLIVGDFNIHFKTLNNHNSRKLHDISQISSLGQPVADPTHMHGHLLDLDFLQTEWLPPSLHPTPPRTYIRPHYRCMSAAYPGKYVGR